MNRNLALWIGILGGPFIWLVSFEANFALVPWACIWQGKVALYLVSLVAFIASGAAALLAWREWNQLGKEVDSSGGDTISRARVMGFAGVALSSFSCILILAQFVPELVLGACQ